MKSFVAVAGVALMVSSLGALKTEAWAADPALVLVRELPVMSNNQVPVPGPGPWRLASWRITDISDDGSTIIGHTISAAISATTPIAYETAFIWRPADGTFEIVEPLMNPSGNPNNPDDNIGLPYLTNADGSKIAFLSPRMGTLPPYLSVRQRASGFPRVFAQPILDGDEQETQLVAMSASGEAVLASAVNYVAVPLLADRTARSTIYTSDDTKLLSYTKPEWDTPYYGLQALHASSDLSTVLVLPLDAEDPRVANVPFGRLVAPDVIIPVNTDPMTSLASNVTGLSGNGSAMVGWNVKPSGVNIPLLWPSSTPISYGLARPRDAMGGRFQGTSGNGEVAVGTYQHKFYNITRPMVWIKSQGNRDLLQVLAKFGMGAPPNVALRSAFKVSEDGRSIMGFGAGTGPLGGRIYVYRATLPASEVCYCNCDGSTGPGYLNADDILCFQQRLAGKQFYTNCDNSIDIIGKPTYDAADMQCFLARFEAGCPEE